MLRKRKRQREKLFTEQRKGLFDDLTWTCHICKQERPDNKISVFTRRVPMNGLGDVFVTENIRHCNDNLECVDGAKTYTHFNNIKKED